MYLIVLSAVFYYSIIWLWPRIFCLEAATLHIDCCVCSVLLSPLLKLTTENSTLFDDSRLISWLTAGIQVKPHTGYWIVNINKKCCRKESGLGCIYDNTLTNIYLQPTDKYLILNFYSVKYVFILDNFLLQKNCYQILL